MAENPDRILLQTPCGGPPVARCNLAEADMAWAQHILDCDLCKREVALLWLSKLGLQPRNGRFESSETEPRHKRAGRSRPSVTACGLTQFTLSSRKWLEVTCPACLEHDPKRKYEKAREAA